MMKTAILVLPGLFNSGEDHWQTLWEKRLSDACRVQQQNWDSPRRSEWVATLDKEIVSTDGSIILVAHSLGCALTAWWAKECGRAPHAEKVKAALLVAPPDVERSDFPEFVSGFAPMPRITMPFRATVVASSDDPWCESATAQSWAAAWGADFHDIGPCGHINGESGLDDWPQGWGWLAELQASV